MAVTNFLVTSLPDYVQTNREVLIKSFGLVGTGTRRHIGLQTGIKKDSYLNFLDLSTVLQDGSNCAFNPLDSITLSQREINTAAIKVDGQICPETLLGKYAEYLVRVNATENELPFEQYILDMLVASINKKIENLIWKGDTASTDPDLKWIDGFLKQFTADNDVVKVTIGAGTSAYEGIQQVYMALPDEAIERGAVIFAAPSIYRAFIQDLISLNYSAYAGPNGTNPDEFLFPGSTVRVVRTPGLGGSLSTVGTFGDNLVYGTDMENDHEDVDLWWSQDDRVFKYQVKWNSGVAYHFPDQIVVGTFAAAPSALGICPCNAAPSDGE